MAKVVFVCWGNICCPPMAEWATRGMAAERGLSTEADSADTSSEGTGSPVDQRAATVLCEAGYSTGGHRVWRVTADDLAPVDFVIVVERLHIDRLEQLCPDAGYTLINNSNPVIPRGQDLNDPWYGPTPGFRSTLADIEAAMPGILDALVQLPPLVHKRCVSPDTGDRVWIITIL